jgi:hypothetical protein
MRKLISFLLVGILFLAGCENDTLTPIPIVISTSSQTHQPTKTVIPSRTPTVTRTVTPTLVPTLTSTSSVPLVSHDWKPNPILITYYNDWDGFCGGVCPPDPPSFVLYGDGNFFMFNSVEADTHPQYHYLHKKLDRSETCRILNTIDQTGFFEFDPSTYSIGKVYDASNWRIEVYAWRRKDVSLYALGEFLDFLGVEPDTVPSTVEDPPYILNTFTLLYNFPPDGLDIYIPDVLGI